MEILENGKVKFDLQDKNLFLIANPNSDYMKQPKFEVEFFVSGGIGKHKMKVIAETSSDALCAVIDVFGLGKITVKAIP